MICTLKFEIAQQTIKTSFMWGSNDKSTSPASKQKVLTLRITCSTKILTLAILLVFFTSLGDIWEVLFLPGGTTNSILRSQHSLIRLNPLSAINIE